MSRKLERVIGKARLTIVRLQGWRIVRSRGATDMKCISEECSLRGRSRIRLALRHELRWLWLCDNCLVAWCKLITGEIAPKT